MKTWVIVLIVLIVAFYVLPMLVGTFLIAKDLDTVKALGGVPQDVDTSPLSRIYK